MSNESLEITNESTYNNLIEVIEKTNSYFNLDFRKEALNIIISSLVNGGMSNKQGNKLELISDYDYLANSLINSIRKLYTSIPIDDKITREQYLRIFIIPELTKGIQYKKEKKKNDYHKM